MSSKLKLNLANIDKARYGITFNLKKSSSFVDQPSVNYLLRDRFSTIDGSLFLANFDHVHSFANALNCPICLELPIRGDRNLVKSLDCCGQIICTNCFKKWLTSQQELLDDSSRTTCPMCRSPAFIHNLKDIPSYIQTIFQKLKCKCPYQFYYNENPSDYHVKSTSRAKIPVCNWIGTYSEMKSHASTCLLAPCLCPFTDCSQHGSQNSARLNPTDPLRFRMTRFSILHHLSSCSSFTKMPKNTQKSFRNVLDEYIITDIHSKSQLPHLPPASTSSASSAAASMDLYRQQPKLLPILNEIIAAASLKKLYDPNDPNKSSLKLSSLDASNPSNSLIFGKSSKSKTVAEQETETGQENEPKENKYKKQINDMTKEHNLLSDELKQVTAQLLALQNEFKKSKSLNVKNDSISSHSNQLKMLLEDIQRDKTTAAHLYDQSNYPAAHFLLKDLETRLNTLNPDLVATYDSLKNIKLGIYNDIAVCLIRLKRYSETFKFLKSILEFEPTNENALFRLAHSYYHSGINYYQSGYDLVLKLLHITRSEDMFHRADKLRKKIIKAVDKANANSNSNSKTSLSNSATKSSSKTGIEIQKMENNLKLTKSLDIGNSSSIVGGSVMDAKKSSKIQTKGHDDLPQLIAGKNIGEHNWRRFTSDDPPPLVHVSYV